MKKEIEYNYCFRVVYKDNSLYDITDISLEDVQELMRIAQRSIIDSSEKLMFVPEMNQRVGNKIENHNHELVNLTGYLKIHYYKSCLG